MSNTVGNPDQKQIISISLLEEEAQKIIRNYTIAATGSGIIPIPFLSGTMVTGVQVLMIRDLCELYGVSFDKGMNKVIVNASVGSLVSKVLTFGLTLVPGMSGPVKGISDAGIAGLYTATVGEYYKVHFQRGGDLENSSLQSLGQHFIAEIQRGEINLYQLTSPSAIVKRMMKQR